MKKSFLVVVMFTLSACGGGSDVNEVAQEPSADTLEIVGEGITFKRFANPNEGVRWRRWSDGSREIWFDTDLAVMEDSTVVQGTTIINSNSTVRMIEGLETGGEMIEVLVPVAPSDVPLGSVVYTGEALMQIDVSGTNSFGGSGTNTLSKFASATMTIDFAENSGQISVSSVDGRSELTSSVNAYEGTWLEGVGTFTTSGDSFYISGFRYGAAPISESTKFDGTLTGSRGQGAAGVFMGDNHVVGITLE